MTLGIELIKQRAKVDQLREDMLEAGGQDLQGMKDQLKKTKDKVRKLERKIKESTHW